MSATDTAHPGLRRDQHHRYYYGSTGPLPGVTSIVKVVDRSGPLVGWAKRETAASAVRNLDMLQQMVRDGGKDSAQQWLSRIPDYQKDEAADIGQRVHALGDAINRGEDIQPTGIEVPYVAQYRAFLADVRPVQLLATEALVCNLTVGYGGTLDSGWLIDGIPTLLDIKTGKGVYDETALQLAGYANAEFTGTPDDPTQVPLPAWQRYGVLHLRPDGWSLIPYDVTPETFEAFKAALTIYRWLKDTAAWTKGTPITEGVLA